MRFYCKYNKKEHTFHLDISEIVELKITSFTKCLDILINWFRDLVKCLKFLGILKKAKLHSFPATLHEI